MWLRMVEWWKDRPLEGLLRELGDIIDKGQRKRILRAVVQHFCSLVYLIQADV